MEWRWRGGVGGVRSVSGTVQGRGGGGVGEMGRCNGGELFKERGNVILFIRKNIRGMKSASARRFLSRFEFLFLKWFVNTDF